jgi:hypothetical protein
MSIEIGARCGHKPDPATTARVAALVMRAALGETGIDGVVEHRGNVWDVHWGNAAPAVAILVEPGRHEFGDEWFLSVHPGARGMALPMLLAIVVAAAAALTTDGIVYDEIGILDKKEHDPRELLDRLLVSDKRDVGTALRALKVTDSYTDED